MIGRILNTSLFSYLSRGMLTLTNLVIVFLISRQPDGSMLGVYGISFFFFNLFALLSCCGLNTFFSKEIAFRRGEKRLREGILAEVNTCLLLGLLMSLLVVTAAVLFYKKIGFPLLTAVMVAGFFHGWERNLNAMLLGEERMDVETLSQFINLLLITLPLVFLIGTWGILGIYLLRIASSVVTVPIRLFFVSGLGYRLNRSIIAAFPLRREKVFFFWGELLVFIHRQIDIFVLSLLITVELLGGYFLALRIYFAFGLLAEISASAFVPFVSRTFRGKERNGFSNFNRKISGYFLLLGLVFVVVLLLFRKPLVSLFSAELLGRADLYLIFLALILFFTFNSHYTAMVLSATRYQKQRFQILLVTAIISIGLNICLGLLFSIYGILIARAVTEVFRFLALSRTVRRINLSNP